MSKYALYGVLTLYLIIVTIIVDNTTAYTVTTGIDEAINTGGFSVDTLFTFGKTFIGIIFFEIEGFPPILWLLMFHPALLVFLFMTLDILKDIIPFT